MRRYPGEVFRLPPEALEGGDPKPRRHVLMCDCEGDADASLAYASTSSTEASFGATHLVLDPYRTTYRSTGFDKVVNIYLSRLVSFNGNGLTEQLGKVIDEMPKLRQLLAQALGLDTGTCEGSGPAAGSLRGRILELASPIATETDTPYVVAVCEPAYSRERRYVHCVPLYADGFDAEPEDMVVERAPWFSTIGDPPFVIVAPGLIASVFYPTQVSRPLPAVIDPVTMSAIDDALRIRFGL